jgi:uncharacterized DUF497 family protein
MEIAWNARKAAANLKKHKVSFEEASTIFADSLAITGADPDHSVGEVRWITFGQSVSGRLLAVAHTDEDDTIRIISARTATRHEKRFYEEG